MDEKITYSNLFMLFMKICSNVVDFDWLKRGKKRKIKDKIIVAWLILD